MSEACVGANVQWCGHDGCFIADIYKVGNVNVVKYAGKSLDASKLSRPANNLTHHLVDFPVAGFWRADIGMFVVPENQCIEIKVKESKDE